MIVIQSYLPVYMESCCWRSLFYIAVVCIATVSARDGDNTTTNGTKMYEPCVNATCPMPRCRPGECNMMQKQEI